MTQEIINKLELVDRDIKSFDYRLIKIEHVLIDGNGQKPITIRLAEMETTLTGISNKLEELGEWKEEFSRNRIGILWTFLISIVTCLVGGAITYVGMVLAK